MLEFIGIGDVGTVPCEQEIEAVVGGISQVTCISGMTFGHYQVTDVSVGNVIDLFGVSQDGDRSSQGNNFILIRVETFFQFCNDSQGRKKVVPMSEMIPPLNGHLVLEIDAGIMGLVIIAWDGRFNVYGWFFHGSS